ncbi:aspartyl protease family protein [Phaeovibrio sulfidiphilus]|uniref:Aspartyl protease family protein n=1 Tax=Phaeovibrio sulfidiphilus TaxID=1220600 RepID=A0A8J6YIQ9_9PROT|nr:aspartyl protease family protein [Phaeovibrio sulfidiphilus]MBE1237011.1 aspartyl protease family protein [Phaeovibrio sulfidiphilus]
MTVFSKLPGSAPLIRRSFPAPRPSRTPALARTVGLALALALAASLLPGHEARSATTSLPLQTDDLGIANVDMPLGGTTERFILDTGSRDALHLPASLSATIPGLRWTGEKARSLDLTGTVSESDRFVIPRLSLGHLTLRDVQGVALKPWGLSIGGYSAPEAGVPVVGLEFFKDLWTLIDLPNNRLTLGDRGPLSRDGWTELPYRLDEEGLVVMMTDGTRTYPFVLDTAASASLVKAEILPEGAPRVPLDAIRPASPNPGSGGNSGAPQTGELRFTPLKVAGIDDSPVFYALVWQGLPEDFRLDGLLGQDFFERFAVQFNMREKRLLVKPLDQ